MKGKRHAPVVGEQAKKFPENQKIVYALSVNAF